jgi:predicted hotdog family 3-hydroxylacyl-ACP dehydratase
MFAEALARMPHAGAMRLIADIEGAEHTRISCRASDHSAQDYPLRLDGVLYTAALVELGAQAAAAHASLFGVGAAHSGLVLALSDVELPCARVEGAQPIRVVADRLDQIEGAAAYRFTVLQSVAPLATGTVLLSMRPV